ncbi:hypothetical protein [Microbacterium gorillae]|uniref:hypothetical protein n=1 Tax=Microbacterium gorillae TaxID=1231063 RepID=UPI0005909807|nr:hypothetical protein [Microbacterium gorillae]
MSDGPEAAQRSLQEIGGLTATTRRASRALSTGLPLVGRGIAWTIGLAALDLLDGPWRIAVVAVAWVLGMTLSWVPARPIRTGIETRLRWGWGIVLCASPFLVAAAQPATLTHAVLLVGSIWGLAMCLYGVATGDRAFAAVAGFGVVIAGTVALLELPHPLLWYGFAAGVTLLGLGVRRIMPEASRA